MINLKKRFYLFSDFKPIKFLSLSLILLIFEFIGVVLLIPLIQIFYSNDFLKYNYFDFKENDFVFYFLSFIIFIFSIKFALSALIINFQNKILFKQRDYIILKYIRNLQDRGYSNFIKEKVSFYNDMISNQVRNYSTYIETNFSLINEFIFISTTIILLLFINPIFTIIIIVFVLIGNLAYRNFLKKKIFTWGKEKLYHESSLSSLTLQLLNNYKSINLFGIEKVANEEYEKVLRLRYLLDIKQSFANKISRYFIEFFITILFVIIILNNYKSKEFLFQVLIFGGLLIRILPSLSKIALNLTLLEYSKPSFVKIVDFLNSIDTKKTKNQKFELIEINEIELKNISFKLNNRILFKNLNYKFKKGDLITVFGQSGSGKTTLLDIISKLKKPSSGFILLNGKNILTNQVAYVNQSPFIFDKDIYYNISLKENRFITNIDRLEIKRLIKKVDKTNSLKDFVDNSTLLGENGSKVSGGMKQKVELLRSLYSKKQIILFDEPTSALDDVSKKEIIQVINEIKKEKIIFISTHENIFKEISNYLIKI